MKNRVLLSVFIVIILSLGTIFPLFKNGFFTVHDDTAVARVYEMSKSLSEGAFPARWVPDLGYGYGYPIYNFYSPFPYFIGGSLNLLGFDLLLSTKLMIGLGVILAPISMYFFVRKFYSNSAAIIAAICYAYFPYHAVNIYVRGAIGEYYGYAFLPLVFLGLYSLLTVKKIEELKKRSGAILVFIFGIFFIAVSHNLTILMTLLLFVPAILIGIIVALNKKVFLLASVLSLVLGLLLASFYIVPAFFEKEYTNVISQIGGGADYSSNFVCISQIWQSQWGYGGSIPGCIDGLSFTYGKLNILITIASITLSLYVFFRKKVKFEEKYLFMSLLLLFISIFLSLDYSKYIWDSLKIMEYIQYPWRFSNFSALFISFTFGYFAWKINKLSRLSNIFLIVIIFTIILISLKHFVPRDFNNYDKSYYTDNNYLKYTVSKISDEYLPKNFNKPKSEGDLFTERFTVDPSVGVVTLDYENILNKKASYAFMKDGYLHTNIAYFPAWSAYINGSKTSIIKKNNGMDIFVKKGEGDIAFVFEQTVIEVWSNIITIVVFILIIIGIIFYKYYGKETS